MRNYNKTYRRRKDVRAKIREYDRKYSKENKMKVLNHYGIKCAWCGIKNPIVLSIDHIKNDGGEHRRKVSNGDAGCRFYIWLRKNNYPGGFQTLCLNCNYAKRFGYSKEDMK